MSPAAAGNMSSVANTARERGCWSSAHWLLMAVLCLGWASLLAGCKAGRGEQPSPSAKLPASGVAPTSAPDFGCLAFQVEPDMIWLVRGGRAPQSLTQGREPLLSPDGRFLAFLRSFPNEVWVRALDDSSEALLYVGKPMVYSMAWSPDGETLAITNGAEAKLLPSGDLWRVDVPTGTVTELASERAGYPVFSPDGRWIALSVPQGWTRGSVAIIRGVGQDYRLLFDDVLLQTLEWAEDSSGFALALTRMGTSGSQDEELWFAPVDGDPVPIGRLSGVGALQWQPGAQRLLYAPLGEEEGEQLILVNGDGNGRTEVPGSEGMILRGGLYGRGLSPWSADGRWFLLADTEGSFYLLDTVDLDAPRRLDAEMVYGWLDAAHYLAGRGGESYTDLYRCGVLGSCEYLAQVPGRVAAASYTDHCAE
jgi:hypothetical protein